MPTTKNLTVPYHAATSPDQDGPASIQMILDQIGSLSLPTQAAIYTQIQANNAEPDWYSDPSGVNGALNTLKPPPPTFRGGFVIYNLATENEGSRRITYTLHHYQVATATLVYSGGHWVVVTGVQTDVDPLANPDYSIDGFWIHNPWPNDPAPDAPSQNVWIDYATWIGTYFTAVLFGPPGGMWLNHYVSVCDPMPLAIGQLKPLQGRRRADGQQLLHPERAVAFLRAEVEHLGLLANEAFRAAWESGQPAAPILMQRLDHNDTLSYLCPWQDADGVRAIFNLDARYGVLREAALFPRPAPFPPYSRDALLTRLASGTLDVVTSSDWWPTSPEQMQSYQLLLRPGTWCLQEALVWLPCWESRSSAFPFYLLSVADRHYYISTLNGTVYDRLRAFGRPGRVRRGGA